MGVSTRTERLTASSVSRKLNGMWTEREQGPHNKDITGEFGKDSLSRAALKAQLLKSMWKI